MKRCCNTLVVREKICTPDIELLTVSLRRFYLPHEFQQLFYTIVYIHLQANVSAAAQLIAEWRSYRGSTVAEISVRQRHVEVARLLWENGYDWSVNDWKKPI